MDKGFTVIKTLELNEIITELDQIADELYQHDIAGYYPKAIMVIKKKLELHLLTSTV